MSKLKIYDSMQCKKVLFEPIDPKNINKFVKHWYVGSFLSLLRKVKTGEAGVCFKFENSDHWKAQNRNIEKENKNW